MANTDADPQLTRRQVENIRAQYAVKANKIMKFLVDVTDGKIEGVNTARITAAKTFLAKVMPDQQQIQAIEDKPVRSKEEIEADLVKAIKALPPERLAELMTKAYPTAQEQARQ